MWDMNKWGPGHLTDSHLTDKLIFKKIMKSDLNYVQN